MATIEGSSAAAAPSKDLFEGVHFAIIPMDLGEQQIEKITKALMTNGATYTSLSSSELRNVTHLIAVTSDFPGYHEAIEGFIHVVRPSWVDHSILKKKVANPRQYSPDPMFFLSDVVVTCADDIPQGDKDAIVAGVLAMGGQYSAMLTKLTTHVVALSINNPQCKVIIEKGLHCKPVLPHWFDACLKLGKKINPAPYTLPDPPILERNGKLAPIRQSQSTDLLGATLLAPQTFTPPASPSKGRTKLADVFRNKNVMLHDDLNLSARLKQSLADLITKGGGSVDEDVNEVDMLICQFRDSEEFKTASRGGKDVGNLSWLYFMINHGKWTAPTRRLLHYPLPNGGIKGFSNFKISISNYAGEARIYLENLVKAAGGIYTKSMAQENTHLITAHSASEKCTAAKEWNIEMVNHLWLEESYARCKVQNISNPRYTTFPDRTNLCEVVGQTPIDRSAVESQYFPRTSQTGGGQLEPIEPNSSAARTPAVKSVKDSTKGKGFQTPLRPAPDSGTPSSRGAKERALSKLHSMAPDIALYEKESKRAGGVVYGGRRVTDPERITLNNAPTGRKRSSVEAGIVGPLDADIGEEEEDEEGEDDVAPKNKKQKKAKATNTSTKFVPTTTEPPLKVLVTGYEKDGNKASSALKTKLRSLNIILVEDPCANIDVIAAPKILRTRKFLIGVATAPAIVNVKWLEDMAAQKQRLPVEDYSLRDAETERKSNLDLAAILDRARKNRTAGGMLKGWTVFCTDAVKGGFDTFEAIVKANGGACLLFKGRETTVPRQGADSDHANTNELYLVTDWKDRSLWAKFRAMAAKEGLHAKVVRPDWLLRLSQSQNLDDWQDDWEFVEDKDG